MIMAYMRPWSPVVLKEHSWQDDGDKALHERMRGLRNEVVGHSAPARNTVRPWRAGEFKTHIESFPHPYFLQHDLHQLSAIASSLADKAAEERRAIMEEYS